MHGLKSPNFFPTIGANGSCSVHVNFGQMGFVFIEANVKKWGLAPMTGSLAPPPPYGSEQGSILLETGCDTSGAAASRGYLGAGYRSAGVRPGPPTSPGPQRSPTDISLAQLAHIPSHEDAGEGSSRLGTEPLLDAPGPLPSSPPPEYSSPDPSRRNSEDGSATSQAPLVRDAPPSPPIPSYDAAVGRASTNDSNDAPDQTNQSDQRNGPA